MTRELPSFLQDLLNRPPHAGEGVHAWLFRVARQLHAHLPAGEIVRLLEARAADCGRRVPRSEILSAVQNALPCAWAPSGKAAVQSFNPWPHLNEGRRAAIVRHGTGLGDLWESSPVRIEDNAPHTEALIDSLFPGNPLLCCGKSSSVFGTKPRAAWRGELTELQLIVPSPMSALVGRKKNPQPGESEWSAHTLDNTGPRRFLIVEFDKGKADEHAAILLHLAGYAPMVLAVHSGNKSLHGWFYCVGQPEEKVKKFFRYAVSLGADSRLWTPCQFVRMPDGARANGRRQVVYFFNPKPLEVKA